jgi:transposase
VKSHTVKLYPTREQAAKLDEWFHIAAGVWNWAHGKYANPSPFERTTHFALNRQTKGHAKRIGFDSVALQLLLKDVDRAWRDHKSGLRGRPRRKGKHNKIASIPFRQTPKVDARTVGIPSLGRVKAKGQRAAIPEAIKTMRLHRRPRGWYVTIVTDGEPNAIPLVGTEQVGIDLGYSTLATLSSGEKIANPNEYRLGEQRIGQANRAKNYRLLGSLQQRLANAKRHRNHTISRDLVSRFNTIYVSKDNIRGLQRIYGKSVLNAAHFQLREMLATKCRQAGRVYLEVPGRNSTRTCSSCGSLEGPTGLRGLKVREWVCSCGEQHDRDVNAARNTLILGAVLAHERRGDAPSEISVHR